MEPHLQKTLDSLLDKLSGLEKQVADARRLANSLCELGGIEPMFAVVDDSPTLTTIKADTFYGQPFATAAAAYLRMRKSKNMGPATVNEIHEALKQGGYQFDAKNDDYARRGIRNSLQKNTATFHRVPNGEFGLSEWYPAAKKSKPAKPDAAAAEGIDDEGDHDVGDDSGDPGADASDNFDDDLPTHAVADPPPWEQPKVTPVKSTKAAAKPKPHNGPGDARAPSSQPKATVKAE